MPSKFCPTFERQDTLGSTLVVTPVLRSVLANDPVKLVLEYVSAVPPTVLAHTPPPIWSGAPSGDATKAEPVVMKAVLTVPIIEVIAVSPLPTTPISLPLLAH